MRRVWKKRRSHGHGELGECCRQAKRRWDVGGEFVVAAAEVLHERKAGGYSFRGLEAFESAHWPQPRLQATMIGFDPIVAVLLSRVRRGRVEFAGTRRYGPAWSVVTSTGAGPCRRACRCGELSQQPMRPQDWHIRRCTQVPR